MTNKDKQKNDLKKSFITQTQSIEDKEKELDVLLNRNINQPEVVADDEITNKEKHRITLDLSKQLARKVKAEAVTRDQTLKAFIVDLINRYFDDREKK